MQKKNIEPVNVHFTDDPKIDQALRAATSLLQAQQRPGFIKEAKPYSVKIKEVNGEKGKE